MTKITILDDYQSVAMASADWSPLLARAEIHSHTSPIRSETELLDILRDSSIVVAMRERTPFPRHVLARLPQLRLLVTTGMHNASIDKVAARDLDITVCGTRSGGHAAAELTWGLILSLMRKIHTSHQDMKIGGWNPTLGNTVRGKRLGVLGLGRFGSQVARIGLAFGMDVTAWSQNLTEDAARAAGVARAPTLPDLLTHADILTIHLVLSRRTRGLIGASELDLMQPGSYLVNTARAGIVDNDALERALVQGKLAGAALDVFDEEPLPHDNSLRTLDNVLLTPHLGYVTEENYAIFFRDVVEDIESFLEGRPIRVLECG